MVAVLHTIEFTQLCEVADLWWQCSQLVGAHWKKEKGWGVSEVVWCCGVDMVAMNNTRSSFVRSVRLPISGGRAASLLVLTEREKKGMRSECAEWWVLC